MKFLYHLGLFTLTIFFVFSCKPSIQENAQVREGITTYQRIISLDGAITETLFALGQGEKLVGIDRTSTYPPLKITEIPKLGHIRQLNAEAVLGLSPDLIIALEADRDNKVIQQLVAAKIEFLFVSKPHTLDGPMEMASTIAAKLGGEAALEQLITDNTENKQKLESLLSEIRTKPRVLFIYARGKGSMSVAGKNTSAEAIIQLAGGENAMTEFEEFQALSAEGLIEAAPDVLLLFESGLRSISGIEGLLEVPGVQQTPAGKNKKIIAMDGHYLLGFGPRAAQAAIELATKLHQEDIGNS